MDQQEKIIFDLLVSVIHEVTVIDVEKITLNALLENNLFMDELDYAEIAGELEDKLDIELPMEMNAFKTVKNIVDYICENIK